MNVPNSITVARIGLVPIFVLLAYGDSTAAAVGALAVFVVASLSDSLDGYLARRQDRISPLGEFLDPFADKVLVGAAVVVLITTRGFPVWAAIVLAAREVAVQVLRIRVVRSGRRLPASPAAKSKTLLQIVMVGWWLIPFEGLLAQARWLWLGAALAATVWSGVEYFVKASNASAAPETAR